MVVEEEENESESELGGTACQHEIETRRESQKGQVKERDLHVKHTVSDDLGVDRDDVGSLGQSPNNGVSGPEADMLALF